MATQQDSAIDFAQAVFNARPTEGPWQKYNLAPESRTLFPKTVYRVEGDVQNASSILDKGAGPAIIGGTDAQLTLDFGINTCGLLSLELSSNTDETLAIAFSESSLFVGRGSDRSMDPFVTDGLLRISVKSGKTSWTCPEPQMRGAFRYVTFFLESEGTVKLCGVSTYNNMMPSMQNRLRDYSGYFHSDDDFLNTIWYAGAYTVQISTIPSHTGRRSDWVHQKTGWANDSPAARPGTIEVLTDGARRDRTVWSGDRAISTLTNFIALNSKQGAKNGVDWMFDDITEEGEFPRACRPIWSYGSDSYHVWTYIALYDSYFYDGSADAIHWIREKWPQYTLSMRYILAKVDQTGLLMISLPLDWGRHNLQGHNLETNCILYRSLLQGAELAEGIMEDAALAEQYKQYATAVKKGINDHLWDPAEGLYRDYIGAPLHPQDGNTLAIWYDVASEDRKQQVSAALPRRWTKFGAVAPESPGMISPFCSSMELVAHFTAKRPARAMELLRTMWGYMWNAPYSVQSSLIEGYFKDGSCRYPFVLYDPSYISHAHPWASGPTIVLTFYLVGLRLLDARHDHWIFEPQPVDDDEKVTYAMTGFTSDGQGFFSAGWKKQSSEELILAIKAPNTTKGKVGVPLMMKGQEVQFVTLNEEVIPIDHFSKGRSHLYLEDVSGGQHTLIAKYGPL